MSNVNYNTSHKGVRLISSDEAWVKGKKGKSKLNPQYRFVGKVEVSMPNMIVSASDKVKPKYKGSVCELKIIVTLILIVLFCVFCQPVFSVVKAILKVLFYPIKCII